MNGVKEFPERRLVNEPRKLEISNRIRKVIADYDIDLELAIGILDTVKAQMQHDAFKRQEQST